MTDDQSDDEKEKRAMEIAKLFLGMRADQIDNFIENIENNSKIPDDLKKTIISMASMTGIANILEGGSVGDHGVECRDDEGIIFPDVPCPFCGATFDDICEQADKDIRIKRKDKREILGEMVNRLNKKFESKDDKEFIKPWKESDISKLIPKGNFHRKLEGIGQGMIDFGEKSKFVMREFGLMVEGLGSVCGFAWVVFLQAMYDAANNNDLENRFIAAVKKVNPDVWVEIFDEEEE